jgi:DNA-binding NtrC family response regulator
VENKSLLLLAIVELGGYPNLAPLYRRLGFDTEVVNSQRKAQSFLKKRIPDVIVAEYNFQSDFRDRTSNLETLMARLQRHPEVKVVVFFQEEYRDKLENLLSRFPVFEAIPFPVEPARVEAALRRALTERPSLACRMSGKERSPST